jgi:biotin synthase-related radical SAM superfamily protein
LKRPLFHELKPERVRVSVGTAAALGLIHMRLNVAPTTAYMMSYTEGSCTANCSFCAQAKDSSGGRDQLSRVEWPDYPVGDVVDGFRNSSAEVLQRVCLQVINYPGFLKDTLSLMATFKETGLPISVDTCPVGVAGLRRLMDAGVDRVSIPLDGATPDVFNRIKGAGVGGPYTWETHMEALRDAVKVFGTGNVGSNLIVGLGETEREAAQLVQILKDMGVITVLFAFTPLEGTKLSGTPQPPLDSYRRIQAARHLIDGGQLRFEEMSFDEEGRITGYGHVDLAEALGDGAAFMTTGCPACNRPFYNERPSGPYYNYPRPLKTEEAEKEIRTMGVEQVD